MTLKDHYEYLQRVSHCILFQQLEQIDVKKTLESAKVFLEHAGPSDCYLLILGLLSNRPELKDRFSDFIFSVDVGMYVRLKMTDGRISFLNSLGEEDHRKILLTYFEQTLTCRETYHWWFVIELLSLWPEINQEE